MTTLPEDTTISSSSKTKLEAIAQSVFNLPLSSITKKDLIFLIQMDMTLAISELTVSASSTRPTEVKYATNNYHASMKINFDDMSKLILEEIKDLPATEIVDAYFHKKQIMYNFITAKYKSTENFIRELLYSAEKLDNAPKVGRFNE